MIGTRGVTGRVIVTGMSGTVAPALAEVLRMRGGEVVAWDRLAVPPDDRRTAAGFVRDVRPGALVHCATGSPQWAEDLARVCAAEGMIFVHVSSASVYGTHQHGPFTVAAVPEPSDDYGRYKLECERLVRAANPDARILRIGWQIALRRGGNTMVEHLFRQQAEQGHVAASTAWIPACSFVDDTAVALADAIDRAPGVALLDGNPDWSFWRIASALNTALNGPWVIRASEDFRWDNRMRDPASPCRSIASRLAD